MKRISLHLLSVWRIDSDCLDPAENRRLARCRVWPFAEELDDQVAFDFDAFDVLDQRPGLRPGFRDDINVLGDGLSLELDVEDSLARTGV